jgi:hypothetical protein
LREAEFSRLHAGAINRLTIASGFFLDELRARKYTKVRVTVLFCLFDHIKESGLIWNCFMM